MPSRYLRGAWTKTKQVSPSFSDLCQKPGLDACRDHDEPLPYVGSDHKKYGSSTPCAVRVVPHGDRRLTFTCAPLQRPCIERLMGKIHEGHYAMAQNEIRSTTDWRSVMSAGEGSAAGVKTEAEPAETGEAPEAAQALPHLHLHTFAQVELSRIAKTRKQKEAGVLLPAALAEFRVAATAAITKADARSHVEALAETACEQGGATEATLPAEIIQAAATAVARAAAEARRAAQASASCDGAERSDHVSLMHTTKAAEQLTTQQNSSDPVLDPAVPSPRPLFRKEIETELIQIDPHKVLFIHPCINEKFSCGRNVESTIEALSSGGITPEDIPLITVVAHSCGRLVTVNHRRLYAFRASFPPGAKVPAKLLKCPWLALQYASPNRQVYHGVRVDRQSTWGRGLIPSNPDRRSDCRGKRCNRKFVV
eukprot:gnl/MRDRNA2_/MRDRNA2_135158_c0_seq1.p1 gnl/MRDRNA2_/MRDRNA2_135158_c0~~gnl/MRDRNA2_/MRDRNA2_135158_c0_seq1.p1  ORF type:complete len:424 (+),score=71.23 gnl/MRDRNA2_/MRDRNA2_135158_c0_seq1:77-1348(+)